MLHQVTNDDIISSINIVSGVLSLMKERFDICAQYNHEKRDVLLEGNYSSHFVYLGLGSRMDSLTFVTFYVFKCFVYMVFQVIIIFYFIFNFLCYR